MRDYIRQSTVVENTLHDLITGYLSSSKQEATPRILVLMVNNQIVISQAIMALQQLSKSNGYVRVFFESDDWNYSDLRENILKSGMDDWTPLSAGIKELEDGYDFIFIPSLSFSFVSALTHFDDKKLLAKVVLRALLKGKNIISIQSGANPYHQIMRDAKLDKGTHLLKYELHNQLKKLQGFGVTLIEPDQVLAHIKGVSRKRKVVTEEDVIAASKNNQKIIYLTHDVIVTPLAKDTAKSLCISLVIK
jgi:hypothetical protein